MVDRIEKFFDRLDTRRFTRLKHIAASIEQNNLAGLDIKPMRGHHGWFRCRIGDIRIIFVRTSPSHNIIIDINFRGQAYKRKR